MDQRRRAAKDLHLQLTASGVQFSAEQEDRLILTHIEILLYDDGQREIPLGLFEKFIARLKSHYDESYKK